MFATVRNLAYWSAAIISAINNEKARSCMLNSSCLLPVIIAWAAENVKPPINDRLSNELFSILFLLLQEKNQKKQAKGALNARSSRTGAAPFGNPRHAPPQALEHLNLNPDLVRNVPISDQMGSAQRTDGRKSGHFRLVVKILGRYRFRKGGT